MAFSKESVSAENHLNNITDATIVIITITNGICHVSRGTRAYTYVVINVKLNCLSLTTPPGYVTAA